MSRRPSRHPAEQKADRHAMTAICNFMVIIAIPSTDMPDIMRRNRAGREYVPLQLDRFATSRNGSSASALRTRAWPAARINCLLLGALSQIAVRLGINGDRSEDPHIERMLQSFALLAANIGTRLSDEYPEFTTSLAGMLCPQYLRPVPACTIARFDLGDVFDKLTETVVDSPQHRTLEQSGGLSLPYRLRRFACAHTHRARAVRAGNQRSVLCGIATEHIRPPLDYLRRHAP